MSNINGRVERFCLAAKENWGFVLFLLCLLSIRSSFADWYHVPSGSMLPTIHIGDRILVDKSAYRLDIPFTDIGIMTQRSPARGDIVVIDSDTADKLLVKRVIGVPGDRIEMQNNRLKINGITSSYEKSGSQTFLEAGLMPTHRLRVSQTRSTYATFGPVTVPKHHVLVLGDNRNNSADSRAFGFVPIETLKGKATTVLWSFPEKSYLPATDRWLKNLI
ncbi:signal peptidase I [Salinimonas sediminis]|uniref:Signal peptidase I n=2 Tax=Salinimonas sediminis TaxID=2303538 RepID=A0A346NNK9_9ALTE|nr:signal peptidase I [Salinimonas sediminis]